MQRDILKSPSLDVQPYCVTNLENDLHSPSFFVKSCRELECPGCNTSIPFCIVSGKHVTADDYTICPSCRFDATHSLFLAFVEKNKVCPMCNQVRHFACLRTRAGDSSLSFVFTGSREGSSSEDRGPESTLASSELVRGVIQILALRAAILRGERGAVDARFGRIQE